MKSQKVTIAGQKFGIIYNFGTEIGFENMAGQSVVKTLQDEGQQFTHKHMLQLVIAAILSYYEGNQQEQIPTGDDDLSTFIMQNANAGEVEQAVADVIRLFSEWYHLPTPEAEKLKKEQQHQPKDDDAAKNP